jgi:hypothetical protein
MSKNNPIYLGLTIPNPDLNFTCKKAKLINDYLFFITNSNEILVYTKQEDHINNVSYFDKKFLLLTSMQSRDDIIDIFIMKKSTDILSQKDRVIIAVTSKMVVYYFNLCDGLCFNKVSLIPFYKASSEKIHFIKPLAQRFILFIFTSKAMLFDTYGQVVFKEEQLKVLNKNIPYDEATKEDFQFFSIKNIYQVKDNSFFLQSMENETFFLSVTGINLLLQQSLDYEKTRIRIIKQTFNLEKHFNSESMCCMFHNEDFIVHNVGQTVKVSFVDSVEELTELTSLNSKAKFQIVFIGTVSVNKVESIVVIYKDLTCELYVYDTKLRELKLNKKFTIMVDEKYFHMKYLTGDNVIIGFTDNTINILDLRRFNKNEEKYVDKVINLTSIFREKKNKIFFTNYFQVNFPHYISLVLNEIAKHQRTIDSKNLDDDYDNYNDNLSKIEDKDLLGLSANNLNKEEVKFNITCSAIFSYSKNESIYYIIGLNTGLVIIFDIFFSEKLHLKPITIMSYHKSPIETFTIYDNRILITSSINGTISFSNITVQSLEASKSGTNLKSSFINNDDIESMYSFGQKMDNRKQSIDDYTQQPNLRYVQQVQKDYINRKKSIDKSGQIKNSSNNTSDTPHRIISNKIEPISTFKCYSKLKRILPVVQLDHNFMHSSDEPKIKFESLLAFEMENNETVIYRMDKLKILYRFNQATDVASIQAVYHISNQKSLIFYLSNNSIKVSSYATRTCDRYITDIDKIFAIMRVDEKLAIYFAKPKKVEDYTKGDKIDDLKFDESALEDENTKKKNKDNSYYKSGISYYGNYGKSKTNKRNDNSEISVFHIKQNVTDEKERKLFIKKLYEMNQRKKQSLVITNSKFDVLWIRKVSNLIIDEIISIINTPTDSEKMKKIKIMNILFNPQLLMKIQRKYDTNDHGISGHYMHIGGQYNEFISLNFNDYFSYLENVVYEQQNKKEIFRTNYFNFISLFRIWNFALDLDERLYQNYRLYQPIFEFFPILMGADSSCSLLLQEEAKVEENINFNFKFCDHFNYFVTHQKNISKEKDKKDLFFDKNLLIESQPGYLVNFKFYKVSQNLSHLFHVALFGSLVALLGFEDNEKLQMLIENEKKNLKILTTKKHIEYSNFEMFHNFMYELNEDITLANKDILLVDYLSMEYNLATRHKQDSQSKMKFKLSIDIITMYLNQVYRYIFNLTHATEELYADFAKLTRDVNLGCFNKLDFLSEFELSLITFLIYYNKISEHNSSSSSYSQEKLPENTMIKITQLLVLYVFKIINDSSLIFTFPKHVVGLITKQNDLLLELYKNHEANYAKLLIDFYTNSNIPINLESNFKKFEIGDHFSFIKSGEELNSLKIFLAKIIKIFSKIKMKTIVYIIQEEIKKRQNETKYCSFLLEIIWLLFKERQVKAIQCLPNVISLLMLTMSPALKNICFDNTKKILSGLILNFPMIAFHQNTQKLAVGAQDGVIYIYDMVTGGVWKTLKAHQKEITALGFDHSGNIIISYSSTEAIVKFWKIGLTNFFSNLFSMKDGYYKQQKLNLLKDVSDEEKLKNVKIKASTTKDNNLYLRREDSSMEILKI